MANYEISDWVAIASTEDGYNAKENEISKDLAGCEYISLLLKHWLTCE
jgi:hypothetical protein